MINGNDKDEVNHLGEESQTEQKIIERILDTELGSS